LLDRILRGTWLSLPALLVASAALCAAASVPVLAAPGINPVALLTAALVVAPFAAALAATANAMAFDGAATVRTWWRGLRACWFFGICQALVPAVAAILFLAAWHSWAGRRGWVLPSLVVSGGSTLLAVLGLFAVLPLGVARPRLRGLPLWITALHLVARRPVRFAAALSVAVVGVWAATAWTASLLLVVPAPTTIVMAAAVWTSMADMQDCSTRGQLSSPQGLCLQARTPITAQSPCAEF
jgi:hypothetical protein